MIALALSALLSFTDPQGDANGDGSLQAPTAAVSRTLGSLDITKLELYDAETLTIGLQFASLSNPFNYPNGFSFPIIEIYIDNPETQGSNTLLPGSEMTLPEEAFWDYAFKLTGDALQVFEASSQGVIDISSRSAIKPSVSGDNLNLQTSLPRPQELNLYAVAGNYSPFSKTGWMPTSSSTSPWAYWSESQTSPVVEVVATTVEKQQIAIQSGVLPAIEVQIFRINPWFYMMFTGMTLALLGVIGRFFVKTGPAQSPDVWVDPEHLPGEFMAAERLKNQQINNDILQEAEKLSHEQDIQEPAVTPAPDEIPDTPAETSYEPPRTASDQPKTDDLFNVWVDDDNIEDVDWSISKK